MIKKIILLSSVLILFSTNTFSQIMVYNKNLKDSSDIICNILNTKVYQATSNKKEKILCNIVGNKIYKVNLNDEKNILFIIKNGKVYRGNSTSEYDIMYTIKDGVMYKKDTKEIIATKRGNIVYDKKSKLESDILFRFNADVNTEEFIAVWYVHLMKILKSQARYYRQY